MGTPAFQTPYALPPLAVVWPHTTADFGSIIPAFLWIFYLLNGIIRDDPIAKGIDRFDLDGVIAI